MRALDTQEGGSHYKDMAIQPMEYSMANKLDACQHTIIKYVTRFRSKGGLEDLRKARHTIDMLIEFEEGAQAPAEYIDPYDIHPDERMNNIVRSHGDGEHYMTDNSQYTGAK